MVPINKGHEPFLITTVHDKGQGRGGLGGVLAGDQAGDLDQQAPDDEEEAARANKAGPGRPEASGAAPDPLHVAAQLLGVLQPHILTHPADVFLTCHQDGLHGRGRHGLLR